MKPGASDNTSAVMNLGNIRHETCRLSGGSSQVGGISNVSNSQIQINTNITSGLAEKKSVKFNEVVDIVYFDKSKEADGLPRERLPRNVCIYRQFVDYSAKIHGLSFAAGHDYPCESRPEGYDHEYALSQYALLED